MRTIKPKFRAWDFEDEKMWKVVSISESIWGDCEEAHIRVCDFDKSPNDKETDVRLSVIFSLMQSTTHVDENGIEIYEGDIIEFEFTENSCWGEPGVYTGHIFFDKGVFEVHYHREPIRRFPDGTWTTLSESDDIKSFMSWAEKVKVIGNVHENPELIKLRNK